MKSRFEGAYRLFAGLVALIFVLEIYQSVVEYGWRSVGRNLLYALPIFGVLFFGILLVWLVDRHSEKGQQRFRKKGVRVIGKVTDVSNWTDGLLLRPRSGMQWEMAAEFKYKGKRYTACSNRLPCKPNYTVGDAIPVYCMRNNPERNIILDNDALS